MVEVVKGIQAGEKVVVKPPDRLRDGAKVSLARSEVDEWRL